MLARSGATVMAERDWLAECFETHRQHLRSIAYRMLGSVSEADDAVQDAWLRLSRSKDGEIDNLEAWLTTVIARVCLDALRSRRRRREDSIEALLPDPIVSQESGLDPEQAAILGDSVGLAMLVVLDTLAPAERLAFVLHDVFGVPFDEIGRIVDRTPASARQLASRARRRVRGAPVPDADPHRQRVAVDAFFAAVRAGDFDALLTVLDPEVVVRADLGVAFGGSREVRGARAVATEALAFARFVAFGRPALVNGAAGIVAADNGRTYSVVGFIVKNGKIVEIDILADTMRLQALELPDIVG